MAHTQSSLSAAEHRRLVSMSITIVTAALIVGVLYWWTTLSSGVSGTTSSVRPDPRAQIAASLNTDSSAISPTEASQVAASLSHSQGTPTDAQRQATAQQLR